MSHFHCLYYSQVNEKYFTTEILKAKGFAKIFKQIICAKLNEKQIYRWRYSINPEWNDTAVGKEMGCKCNNSSKRHLSWQRVMVKIVLFSTALISGTFVPLSSCSYLFLSFIVWASFLRLKGGQWKDRKEEMREILSVLNGLCISEMVELISQLPLWKILCMFTNFNRKSSSDFKRSVQSERKRWKGKKLTFVQSVPVFGLTYNKTTMWKEESLCRFNQRSQKA